MQQELTIRRAVPGDERVVAAMLHRPFRPDIDKMTIWESSRIDRYNAPSEPS
jgi:hypothetical protein